MRNFGRDKTNIDIFMLMVNVNMTNDLKSKASSSILWICVQSCQSKMLHQKVGPYTCIYNSLYIYTYVYITYAISFCMCLIIGQAEYINLSIIYNVRLVCLRTLSSGWDVSSFTWSVRHVSYIYICLAILCTNAFSISFQSLNGLLMRTKHCSNLILKTSTMRKVVLWDHWN